MSPSGKRDRPTIFPVIDVRDETRFRSFCSRDWLPDALGRADDATNVKCFYFYFYLFFLHACLPRGLFCFVDFIDLIPRKGIRSNRTRIKLNKIKGSVVARTINARTGLSVQCIFRACDDRALLLICPACLSGLNNNKD